MALQPLEFTDLWRLAKVWMPYYESIDNSKVSKWYFEVVSALSQIESKQKLQQAISPQTSVPFLYTI